MKLLILASSFPPGLAHRAGEDDPIGELQRLLPEGSSVDLTRLDDLEFLVGERTVVVEARTQRDIASYDYVLFHGVGEEVNRAAATAAYLNTKDVPFADSCWMHAGVGKLRNMMVHALHGVPVPQTICARPEFIMAALVRNGMDAYPLIVKGDTADRGEDNYLVHSDDELMNALATANTRSGEMIVQRYVPNDGDYRVLVLAGEARVAVLRKSKPGSHINNVSAGASSTPVDVNAMPAHALRDAARAAALLKIEVAGIDIIVDKITGKYYVLEVNSSPQLLGRERKAYREACAQMIRASRR